MDERTIRQVEFQTLLTFYNGLAFTNEQQATQHACWQVKVLPNLERVLLLLQTRLAGRSAQCVQ